MRIKKILGFSLATFLLSNLAQAGGGGVEGQTTNLGLNRLLVYDSYLKSDLGPDEKRTLGDAINPLVKREGLKRLNFGGYYRFNAIHRNLTEEFYGIAGGRYFGTWDGYNEPQMLLSISGNPTGNASFATDLFLRSAVADLETDANAVSLYMGANLYGNVTTDFGQFYMRAGGINWYSISPMTLGSMPTFQSYSIFDRTPWEASQTIGKYKGFYENNALNQDAVRWNYQAFNGLVLDGVGLPGKVNFGFIYGKTGRNAGGLFGNGSKVPNTVVGGRVFKAFTDDISVSINTINSTTFSDSVDGVRTGFNIITGEMHGKIAGIKTYAEIGIGGYGSHLTPKEWDPGIDLKFMIPESYTLIPIDIEVFHIGKSFVNTNAKFSNTINDNLGSTDAGSQVQETSADPLTIVGQLANNRRGMNLNTEFSIRDLKISVGTNISRDLEMLQNHGAFSYNHRINGFMLSRLNVAAFEDLGAVQDIGAYNRFSIAYRGAYETVIIEDVDPNTNEEYINSDTIPNFYKHYNTVELRAKYGKEILGHQVYLFYVGSANSVQKDFSAIPVFNKTDNYESNKAFMTILYNEFDLYFQLNDRWTLTGYYGLERNIGNHMTGVDVGLVDAQTGGVLAEATGGARDQTGRGVGVGFDLQLSKNAGVYYRTRWFKYSDKSFLMDKYQGNESSLEVKIFF